MNFSSEALSDLFRDTLRDTLLASSQAITNDSNENVTDIVLHHSSTDNECNDIIPYQPEVQSLFDELQRVKQNKITAMNEENKSGEKKHRKREKT